MGRAPQSAGGRMPTPSARPTPPPPGPGLRQRPQVFRQPGPGQRPNTHSWSAPRVNLSSPRGMSTAGQTHGVLVRPVRAGGPGPGRQAAAVP